MQKTTNIQVRFMLSSIKKVFKSDLRDFCLSSETMPLIVEDDQFKRAFPANA